MRIFTGFLIILCSVFIWIFPISESIYDFRTDIREEDHAVSTAAGVTTGNCTLHKPIYDDDITTLTITSNESADSPAYSSYNGTTYLVSFNGLSANNTRTLTFQYDAPAIESGGALDTILDMAPWIYYMMAVLFPIAGVVYIFWEKWFG